MPIPAKFIVQSRIPNPTNGREYGCSVIPSVVGGAHGNFPVPDLESRHTMSKWISPCRMRKVIGAQPMLRYVFVPVECLDGWKCMDYGQLEVSMLDADKTLGEAAAPRICAGPVL